MKRTREIHALAALLLSLASPAQAERYRVDLIVFLDQSAGAGESLVPPHVADFGSAYDPSETGRLRAAGIEVLPDDKFGLAGEWQKLKNSRLQSPILRLAWVQKDPPAEHGTGLHLRWGQPLALTSAAGASAIYPVDGTVTLLAERYLHVDTDLVHTQRTGSGELGSFRLLEKRRVRRNELHHLDSPRLGLLVKVQKADDTGGPSPSPPAAPAKPAAKNPAPKKKP